jgi:hypothetical protein
MLWSRWTPSFCRLCIQGKNYHVFLAAEGNPNGVLYVDTKTPTSFEIRETTGTAKVEVSYRIAAKRIDFAEERLRNHESPRLCTGRAHQEREHKVNSPTTFLVGMQGKSRPIEARCGPARQYAARRARMPSSAPRCSVPPPRDGAHQRFYLDRNAYSCGKRSAMDERTASQEYRPLEVGRASAMAGKTP